MVTLIVNPCPGSCHKLGHRNNYMCSGVRPPIVVSTLQLFSIPYNCSLYPTKKIKLQEGHGNTTTFAMPSSLRLLLNAVNNVVSNMDQGKCFSMMVWGLAMNAEAKPASSGEALHQLSCQSLGVLCCQACQQLPRIWVFSAMAKFQMTLFCSATH